MAGVLDLHWNYWEKDALRVGVASLRDAGGCVCHMETSGEDTTPRPPSSPYPRPQRRAQQAQRLSQLLL